MPFRTSVRPFSWSHLGLGLGGHPHPWVHPLRPGAGWGSREFMVHSLSVIQYACIHQADACNIMHTLIYAFGHKLSLVPPPSIVHHRPSYHIFIRHALYDECGTCHINASRLPALHGRVLIRNFMSYFLIYFGWWIFLPFISNRCNRQIRAQGFRAIRDQRAVSTSLQSLSTCSSQQRPPKHGPPLVN